ncbi:hypothetical protein T08_15903 [Trichinella sp. T8]|nr:hypothetical protein T08_15903 [Trichinella sp. T8]
MMKLEPAVQRKSGTSNPAFTTRFTTDMEVPFEAFTSFMILRTLKNYLQAVSRNNLCWAQVKMRKKFFSGNAHCMTSPIEFALRSFTGSGAYQFFKLHASIQVAFLNKSFIKDATSDILCHSCIKIDTLGLNGVYVSITNCAYVYCSYVRNHAVIGRQIISYEIL